jgi:hypothetical protein
MEHYGSTPESSGQKPPNVGPVTPEDPEKKLSLTALPARVSQGKTKTVSIGLRVRQDIDRDITVEFSTPPEGVTIEPMRLVVAHGHTDAKVEVTASEDAELGEFTVKVMGHLTRGPDAMSELTITVDEV